MSSHTAGFHPLQDLDDASQATRLEEGELGALRPVADWITSFVAQPHEDLGREGPVCPFVPRSRRLLEGGIGQNRPQAAPRAFAAAAIDADPL